MSINSPMSAKMGPTPGVKSGDSGPKLGGPFSKPQDMGPDTIPNKVMENISATPPSFEAALKRGTTIKA